MAEHQNSSSVGNHLADLYNQIHLDQQAVEAAKENVRVAEQALEKTKLSFANYLKESGIDKLLAPAVQQQDLFATRGRAELATGKPQERKPRTSSADKANEVERNKAIYTSQYVNGINEKTGLPVRFKGRSSANEAIDAQMRDDERDYQAKNDDGAELGEANKAGQDAADSLTNSAKDFAQELATKPAKPAAKKK
ncbi:MAG: hypothetical protein EOP45_11495 [Sphingobacteriaceae bacterium]|nr:MAG: hypothetical protein EOP45_11495 [Sphingobacteriaceae bacterium]